MKVEMDTRLLAQSIMKIIRSSLVALVCSFMVGCSPMRYSQFTGKGGVWPAGIWPVSRGTMAETSYWIPVYRGWLNDPTRFLAAFAVKTRTSIGTMVLSVWQQEWGKLMGETPS